MHRRALVAATLLTAFAACQNYDFVFQPDADREGAHLVFHVQTPSKADLLFVVDNSTSMKEEQDTLAAAFEQLASELGRLDTRYRIGLVSTDAKGWETQCDGHTTIDAASRPGARGDCGRAEVVLRRPHDGARGRLMAAYDPQVFDTAAAEPIGRWVEEAGDAIENPPEGEGLVLPPGWADDIKAKLEILLPLDVSSHPPAFDALPGFKGKAGARWVIDREIIRLEACQACGATLSTGSQVTCDPDHEAFATCAEPVARILVQAYFRANMAGLGISGRGYEQGLRASLLAIGIEPAEADDIVALAPANQTTAVPGGANTHRTLDSPDAVSWLREDALLGILYVSDEQDCSMTALLEQYACSHEQGCGDATHSWDPPYPEWIPMPQGSACYQDDFWAWPEAGVMKPARLVDLLLQKKQKLSRIAVGFIGGARPTGPKLRERSEAEQADCRIGGGALADYGCSCLQSSPFPTPEDCNGWCLMTADVSGTCEEATPPATACDALGGSRYIQFANHFNRRTFESICNQDEDVGFKQAMSDFVGIITLACFDLKGVRPLNADPSVITVRRASREQVENGDAPEPLAMTDKTSDQEGWWYDEQNNQICLTGLDRMVGDLYDIFILHKDVVDYSAPGH